MSARSPEFDAASVDAYLADTLHLHDDRFESGRERSHAAGLPQIEVSAVQGKLLELLVRISGARRVLEIGTLGGYSSCWLARGVGFGGRVISCEFEPRHAAVAERNIREAGYAERVSIEVGFAGDTLERFIAEAVEPFDLIFIDADKRSNVAYLDLGVQLARPGTVIVLDNVVRSGEVLDEPDGDDEWALEIRGVRDAVRWLSEDPRVDATALQTVGVKGWDGFALALVV